MSKPHKAELFWQDRVTSELEKLQSQKEFRKKDDIIKAWAKNRNEVNEALNEADSKKPLLSYTSIPKTLPGHDPQETGNQVKKRKFAKVWNESPSTSVAAEKNKKAQIVEISAMPHVYSPPKMTMWAPIERNVLVEDQQHSNIPYFGDDVIDKDHKFIANLVEEVNSKMDISETIDDATFISLVRNLSSYRSHSTDSEEQTDKYVTLYRPSTDLEKSWAENNIKDPSLPGLIVFQAILSTYPGFGSTDDIIKKYKSLTEEKVKPDFVPNIDGPNAEAVTAERALHSYKSLLCRRCFLYDCPLHNDPYIETPLPRSSEKFDDFPLPSTPCGTDCFLSQPGVLASLSPRTPSLSDRSLYNPGLIEEANPLRDITGTDIDVWTGSEITMFRMLVESLPSNWCAIAQMMVSKKCRQVWEFSKKELGKTSRVKRVKDHSKHKKRTTKTKQAALYKGHSRQKESRSTYVPCHHPDQPCSEDVCTCIQNRNFCEKFCYCSIECTNRFPGCRCKSKCTTNLCACVLASRECDPDLCTICLDGTLELDPSRSSCRNVVLQRRMGKKLYVAPSDIAGWGCFLGEKAAKHEFIAEYVGEIISQEESDRRGRVYDKVKCSYMFALNDEYCVDAARMGGKIRFANHSSKPNCKVRILLVNGDHRIGIYANKDIQLGEELFFDYGKDFHGHDIV